MKLNELYQIADYKDNQGMLLNGDCLEYLKKIDDNSIDLIITSPPYNLGKYHHTNNHRFKAYKEYDDNMPEELYQQWQTEILNECYRILKDDGSVLYNHKNRIREGKQITPYEWLLKTDFIIKQEIVWQNGSHNFDKIRFYPFTERIYWMSKSPNTKLNNVISHTDVFTSSEWKPQGTEKEFKRAYPEQMVRDLISCFENSKIILDPFSGSGTTCKVAKEMGKQYIGIELTKDYFLMSKDRLEKVNE